MLRDPSSLWPFPVSLFSQFEMIHFALLFCPLLFFEAMRLNSLRVLLAFRKSPFTPHRRRRGFSFLPYCPVPLGVDATRLFSRYLLTFNLCPLWNSLSTDPVSESAQHRCSSGGLFLSDVACFLPERKLDPPTCWVRFEFVACP